MSVKFGDDCLFTKPSDNVSNPKFGDCFMIPVRQQTANLVTFKVMVIEGDGDFKPGEETELTQVTISKARLDVMKYSKEETVHELVLSFPARVQSPHSSDRSSGGGSAVKPKVAKKNSD